MPNTPPFSRPLRVLLVEDDEDDYILTKGLFADIDPDLYQIEWIPSFEKALELESSDCYDLCLLDYRLGSHDGIELMSELRRRGFQCPMILLTGQGDRTIDNLAMKSGAADYLIKGSINSVDLERAVRYSVKQKEFEDEKISLVREQERRRVAEAANTAKDDFLGLVSHELRTPLNAMLGWVRLLKKSPDDDEIFEKAVDAIERSAQVQTKFVEDLLDVTRIVSGTLKLEKRKFPLALIVESAVNGMRPVADSKPVELVVNIDKATGIANADQERIVQIVNNLVSNAIKFTPEGGRVTLSLCRNGDNAELTIEDTGQGISADFLPHVFERYRQAENAVTTRKGGLGLGLAIVRSIVEMHGGSVSAESEGEGTGAKFTVLLPLTEE